MAGLSKHLSPGFLVCRMRSSQGLSQGTAERSVGMVWVENGARPQSAFQTCLMLSLFEVLTVTAHPHHYLCGPCVPGQPGVWHIHVIYPRSSPRQGGCWGACALRACLMLRGFWRPQALNRGQLSMPQSHGRAPRAHPTGLSAFRHGGLPFPPESVGLISCRACVCLLNALFCCEATIYSCDASTWGHGDG